MFAAFFLRTADSPPGEVVLLQDSTVRFRFPPATSPQSSMRMTYDSIPLALRAAFDDRNVRSAPVATLALPPHLRILASDTLAAVFRDGADEGWMRFERSWPSSTGYWQLSRPGFTADSLSTLFYFEYRCGPLCGRGQVLHLYRDPHRTWRIRRSILVWGSR